MMRWLTPLASGLLFAIGLALSGMTDPEKVLGFLDVIGQWDPSLAFVMLGAISVYSSVYWIGRRKLATPIAAESFPVLEQSTIDRRLLVGSVIFGLGWGLAGYCPGPALVSAASGASQAILFCLAMVAGLWATKALQVRAAPR